MSIVKSKLFYILVLLLLLAYPVKLSIQIAAGNIVSTQLIKYLKREYKTDTKLTIEKFSIKFIDLLGLRFKSSIQNLELEGLAQIPQLDLSIKILPYLFRDQLLIKDLSINSPEIVYYQDFSFAKTKPKGKKTKSRDFILENLLITGASLSLRNNDIDNNFTLNGLELKLHDFIIKEKNDEPATYSIKNKELNLTGTIKLEPSRNYSFYSSKGQITDLDFGKFLTILNGKKQGLSGLLTLKNIKLTCFGTSPDKLINNLLVSGDLSVRDGSLYLLDYIVKTKKVINSVLPVGKVLDVFEVISVDQIKDLNGNRYQESLASDSSKFSSLIAKLEVKDRKIRLNDLKIDTPIMNIKGSGYNSFDQKMSYNLEASLANIPLLPIIVKGVRKIPVVLIDLHGYSYRRAKSVLKLLSPKKGDKNESVKNKA